MKYYSLAAGLSAALAVGCGANQNTMAPTPDAPTAVSVSITGGVERMRVNQTLQLRAFVTFSDGTTADLTGSVLWISALPGVAVVSNGLVLTRSAGSTRISASYQDRSASFLLVVE